jgi:hypothetical protein
MRNAGWLEYDINFAARPQRRKALIRLRRPSKNTPGLDHIHQIHLEGGETHSELVIS